jgi:hypothetical protein
MEPHDAAPISMAAGMVNAATPAHPPLHRRQRATMRAGLYVPPGGPRCATTRDDSEAAFAAPLDWFGGSVAAQQCDDQLR